MTRSFCLTGPRNQKYLLKAKIDLPGDVWGLFGGYNRAAGLMWADIEFHTVR